MVGKVGIFDKEGEVMKILSNFYIFVPIVFVSFCCTFNLYSMEREVDKGKKPATEVSLSDLEAGVAAVRLSPDKKSDSGIVIQPEAVRIKETFDLNQFYNTDTKTLDLSRIPLLKSDDTLKMLYFGKANVAAGEKASGMLIHFIERFNVERLILENMGLKEIPVYIITYALNSEHLNYVSLQHNNFKLPGVTSHVVCPSDSSGLDALSSNPDSGARSSLREASQGARGSLPIPQMQGGSRYSGLAIAGAQAVASLWDEISPAIEQTIQQANASGGNQIKVFKKIIKIHEKLPPLTVVDQRVLQSVQVQPGKREKIVAVCSKVAIAVISLTLGLVPSLISFFATKQDQCSC